MGRKTVGDLVQRPEDEELKNDIGRATPGRILGMANGVRLERAVMLPEPEDQVLQGR